jgi:hypothetical protein
MRTESGGYRRNHLRALARRVEVDAKEIRIMGSKACSCARSSLLRAQIRRSMKMGTTRSPWRYDAATCHALQSANLRRPAILHFASCADGHAEQSRD